MELLIRAQRLVVPTACATWPRLVLVAMMRVMIPSAIVIVIVIITSDGCTDKSCADDTDDCERWVN